MWVKNRITTPEATSHDADHCWQLHPELRPLNSNSKPNGLSFSNPTTQLVEVDEGHESEVSTLLTEAASKPIVLDSGATHHLINNPNWFNPTAESNIKISTGGHSNFLNPTAITVERRSYSTTRFQILLTGTRFWAIQIHSTKL
ncbi:hypothetical protein VP01_2163g1 [Puccinia sorghi]|uniref:Uncharacterized protein n=1 Tax=Puccinia sorghi TaxID=27349 RepID=A0A0L6VA57_9BASI|nr:hypothetical protein VP01_2163g1 [Puccinia sorghi]